MKKFALLIIACLEAFNIAVAQITSQQADALVTNQIYDTIIEYVDIYSFPELLHRNDSIQLFDGTIIFVPYNNCYGYFIDLLPFANWSHPCNYCFLDSNTGQFNIIENTTFPKNWENFMMVSLMDRPQPVDFESDIASDPTKDILPQDPHLWAVLICGDVGDYYSSNGRFWGDLSCVYNTLINNGFIPNTNDVYGDYNGHVFVLPHPSLSGHYSHDLDHDGTSDFYSDFGWVYGRQNLQILLEKFHIGQEWELTPDDKLFIYVTGHGERSSSTNESFFNMNPPGSTGNAVSSSDFSEWLSDVNCSQMVLLMQNCHSGGFVDDFMDVSEAECKNRAVFTASDAEGYSWAERYITATGRSNEKSPTPLLFNVNEFTYYWSAAALGYYPHVYDKNNDSWGPWENIGYGTIGGLNSSNPMPWSDFFTETDMPDHEQYDKNPDTDGNDILSLEELFTFADNLDVWSENGYFYPGGDSQQGYDVTEEHPQAQYGGSLTVTEQHTVLTMNMFPNPATTWTIVEYTLPNDNAKAELSMFNAMGVRVKQVELDGNTGQKVIDLRDFANGVYTITVLCGEYCQTQKIVITK